MLPTPAMRRWSSRNALTGARRPRASARSASPVSSPSSGSRPRRAAKNASRAARPERQLAGAEAPRVAEAQLVAVVEDPAHALVRRARRRVVEQRAGHAQVHEQEDVVLELPDQVLAAPRQPLDAPALRPRRRSPRAPAAGTSAGRRSPGARRRAPRRGARAGGGSSRPRAARALRQRRSADGARQAAGAPRLAARQPVQHRRADVGQRAVVAAAVLAGEGGQQRRVLARVVGVRRARVDAVVGGEHEQVVRRAAGPATRRPRRRSRAARRGSPRRRCGGRRPGRSRPGWRRRGPSSSSPSSSPMAAMPRSLVAAGWYSSMPTPAKRSRTLPTAWTGTPALCSSSRYERPGGATAKSLRPSVRRKAPGRALERPRDHAPDGVLAGHRLARRGARREQVVLAEHVVVGGELQHRVGRRVEDHLAGAQVVLAPLLDDLGPARRVVGAEAQAGDALERRHHVGREAVRVGRQRRASARRP